MKWDGHFFHQYHSDNKLLNSIREHKPIISPGYQQTEGQPPEIRSMAAIPNLRGVWRVQAGYTIDQHGGEDDPDNAIWIDLDDVMVCYCQLFFQGVSKLTQQHHNLEGRCSFEWPPLTINGRHSD